MSGERLAVDGHFVVRAEQAVTRKARACGLLDRDGVDGVLWIEPAKQVHTFGMRFPIDVAHVRRDGVVVHVATMAPGRLGRWGWRTRAIVEAEAGSFAEWGIGLGTQLTVSSRSVRGNV